MVAAEYGQLECMKLLIEAGANVHDVSEVTIDC
jgi:hypothetical protein